MRRWLRSPAPLLRLTAPSSPCREAPWGVLLSPLSPIITTTVTPARLTWAPAPAPAAWLPPRAPTTATPAAPASRAPSPPRPAPPSPCRWRTRRTTAAASPRPAKWAGTAPSWVRRGPGRPSPLRRPPRRLHHNFHLMSYRRPPQTSYQCRDIPLVVKDFHPQPRRCLFLYTLVHHTLLTFHFLPSSCYLPSLPVRSTLFSSQTHLGP